MKSPDFVKRIETMSKETISVLLSSENLSVLGTKKELKERLRDFINDRREESHRDTTTFKESMEGDNTEHGSDSICETAPVFPPFPAITAAQSLDANMQNPLLEGHSVRQFLDASVPNSRSTVQFSESPILDSSYTTQQTLVTVSATNTISQANTRQNLPQFSHQQTLHTDSTRNTNSILAPISSSTLSATANQFQPQFLQNIHSNLTTDPHLNRFYQNNSIPQQNLTQPLNSYTINTLFDEFCKFLQINQDNSFQPNQFLQLPFNTTQYIAQNTNNTHIPNLSQLPQHNTTICQTHTPNTLFTQVNPKRMSYISSALEKRKIFFTGKQGSDPHRFLDYLTECQTSMGITDIEIYNCLPVVLHGESLDWFRLNKSRFPNFQEFSKALISNFSVKNYQDKLMYEALARQQGRNESIATFVTNIRLIFNQMDPQLPQSRQIDIACNNLNPNYIQHIRRSHITTFENLVDEGKDIENNLEKIKNYKGPPNPSLALLKSAAWPKKSAERSHSNKKPPEKEDIAATKAMKFENDKQQKGKNSPSVEIKGRVPVTQNNSDMPNAGECFKCRQQGHLFKECPNEGKYRIFCYLCGKGKVTVVKCPNCKDRQKKNE